MHNSIIVSMDSFQQTKYDDDICNAISFPDETTKMIQVILQEFASKRQKGDIFTFGDCDPTAETCHDRPIFHESRQARQGTDP